MSSFQTLFTKMEDHTLIITINRPDKLNALNEQVMKDLDAVMDRVYKFPEIKSVVITGAGLKSFVAGADVKEFESLSKEAATALSKRGQDIFAKIENSAILESLGLDSEYILSLCSTIEETADGLWKIKPDHYRPRIGKLSCDIVEKILREKGSRIHSSDIVRKFRRDHDHFLENDRALMARMFNDGRFEPIGRTGYWVLKEWGLETGTIREVLATVLSRSTGPMNIDEIVVEVRKIIPCAASSVATYLQESPEKFTKLGPYTYCFAGLAHKDTV
jgi:hypothetical protein